MLFSRWSMPHNFLKLLSATQQQTLCMFFCVEAVLHVQSFDSKEHQASAHTVRDHEVENRMAAFDGPVNLVRLTLQAVWCRGKSVRGKGSWLETGPHPCLPKQCLCGDEEGRHCHDSPIGTSEFWGLVNLRLMASLWGLKRLCSYYICPPAEHIPYFSPQPAQTCWFKNVYL